MIQPEWRGEKEASRNLAEAKTQINQRDFLRELAIACGERITLWSEVEDFSVEEKKFFSIFYSAARHDS
jgi:hypothetical protein